MSPTARVEIRRTDELSALERAAVVDVCVAAHGNPEFRQLFDFVPTGGVHALAFDQLQSGDDVVVSHAMVTTRWLQPAGLPLLRTAFVDAVSTLPAAQGLGLASAVMRRLASVSDGYDIGCLQTDIPCFYTRLGWELWRGALAGRTEDGDMIATPDQRGVMVLRLPRTPALDLDAALSIEVQPARIWE